MNDSANRFCPDPRLRKTGARRTLQAMTNRLLESAP